MSALLFLAQRATAFVLAAAVAVHLGTILYATRSGLTAAEILARTHGNFWFLVFYATFVVAVAIHAPIGLRHPARMDGMARPLGRSRACIVYDFLLALGLRAVFAVYSA